ncbi:MAG TPA: hypothetical protein PKX92_05145 [Edaphocola sp.]|nr:hypothetical protein [Edaphocola sp.]
MRKYFLIASLFFIFPFLNSCGKKDVCEQVPTLHPTQEELDNLKTFVMGIDSNAIFDPRGFYYSITKPGSANKPGICSDIYARYECSDGKDLVYYPASGGSEKMVFDLSFQIYAWKYAFPMIGMDGEIIIYVPPTLREGYDPIKASFHNTGLQSVPADANVVYKLQLIKWN